jgi:hypothetical protein
VVGTTQVAVNATAALAEVLGSTGAPAPPSAKFYFLDFQLGQLINARQVQYIIYAKQF